MSPHATRSRPRCSYAARRGPASWTTLSVNPDATLLSLGTVALGTLSFWIARAVFSAGGSTRSFCRAMAFLGVAAAVDGGDPESRFAAQSVLFLVEPDARSASPFGAFVNRNHFAAWLLMVAAPVVGYSIARMHIHPARRGAVARVDRPDHELGRVFTAIAAMIMVGVLLLTLSRSALAGLGCAAIVGWWLGRPRLRIERTSVPRMLGMAGAAVLMVVLFVDVDGWATRLEHTFDTAAGF